MKYSVKVSFLSGQPKTKTYKVSARTPNEAKNKVMKQIQSIDPTGKNRPVDLIHKPRQIEEEKMKVTKSQLEEMIHETIREQLNEQLQPVVIDAVERLSKAYGIKDMKAQQDLYNSIISLVHRYKEK